MSHTSKNLSLDENQAVLKMLGNKKESVSTAIAQLLFAVNDEWKIQVTGVLCFVKDFDQRGYFFEVRILSHFWK